MASVWIRGRMSHLRDIWSVPKVHFSLSHPIHMKLLNPSACLMYFRNIQLWNIIKMWLPFKYYNQMY